MRLNLFVATLVAIFFPLCMALVPTTSANPQTEEPDSITPIEQKHYKAVQDLYFVQHEKTGLCFAIGSAWREGYISLVDCNAIPADFLLKRKELD